MPANAESESMLTEDSLAWPMSSGERNVSDDHGERVVVSAREPDSRRAGPRRADVTPGGLALENRTCRGEADAERDGLSMMARPSMSEATETDDDGWDDGPE